MANQEKSKCSFEDVRKEVQFEQGLLNQRVGWLVTSQSFLFAPLAIGMPRGEKISASSFFPLVPTIGVVICIFALFGIVAAIIRINDWKHIQYHECSENKQRSNPPLFYFKGKSYFSIAKWVLPLLGFVPAIGLPLVLLSGWLYILIWG